MSSPDDHPRPLWQSMNNNDDNHNNLFGPQIDKGYALSGKIMLTAIVVLFIVVIFIFFLHLYARWYLFRSRRRRNHFRHRRTHFIFYVDPTNNLHPASLASRGLDITILKSLPTFTFSDGDQNSNVVLECAVCLSEFESGERGRRLPNCKHSFHVDCIDMWFHSQSTCPLCRATVHGDSPANVEDNAELTELNGNESTHQEMGTIEVSIEVPAENYDSESSSSMSQGLKSPTSRLLSLKRILSREKRAAIGTSESEFEEFEEGRVETRPQTPK